MSKIIWTWKMYDELTAEQKKAACDQRNVDIKDKSGPFNDRAFWIFIESLFLIDERGDIQKINHLSTLEEWRKRLNEREDLTDEDRSNFLNLRSQKSEVIIKSIIKEETLSDWVLFNELPIRARIEALRKAEVDLSDNFNLKNITSNYIFTYYSSLMLYRFSKITGKLVERELPTSAKRIRDTLVEREVPEAQIQAVISELRFLAQVMDWDWKDD